MAFPKEAFIEESRKQQRSEEFITEAVKYIDVLNSNGFPVLFSIEHLAAEIGMLSDDLKGIRDDYSPNYTYFRLLKKSSAGFREIIAPKDKLKFIQRWINYNILQQYRFSTAVQGFVPETSIKTNASIHSSAKYLLKIDLLKFFDSIDAQRVYGIFRSFGYAKNVAWDLTKLTTMRHRKKYWESLNQQEKLLFSDFISSNTAVLPQGAPTSPLIANIAASRLDKRIMGLQNNHPFKYSRYADDLCFSADKKKDLPSIDLLSRIIGEEGFFINTAKTRLSSAGAKQYVTGLAVTHGVSLSKNKRREIFKHLYFLRKRGLEAHLNHLKIQGINHTNYQDWLLGHISFHYSIDKKIGKKMFDEYNLVNWRIDIDIVK